MAFDGFAQLVSALEEAGELRRVRAVVDPRLEITEIADRVMKAGGPALLFERVKGSDTPLLVNAFGTRSRMALALAGGASPRDGEDAIDAHARAIADLVHTRAPRTGRDLAELAGKLPALAHTVPRSVKRAPCQEIVEQGDEVDLTRLPVLTCWPKDGGPFITLPTVHTRDPDTGARNVGMYRMQVIDRATTAMHWQIHKTGARHFRRAKERGERMPVAVALGGDPALTYAATAPLPDGIDEWMLAGFLRGRSVEHVRCKTIDLEVPACSDIVLEGWVDPSEALFDEGPFGDHTGYYTPVDRFPRFHVTCVTRRRDAIFPATVVGPPPMEDAWLGKATERLFLPLLRMMFPEVRDMNLPVEGAFHNLVLLSIEKQYPFHAQRIAHGLWGAGQMTFSKVICVVDDDVNVQDPAEVTWRLLANLDPKRDVSFVDGPIDQLDHGANQALFGGKACIDGTRKWPEEGYTREWPEVARMDPEVQRAVAARWAELGLGDLGRAPRAERTKTMREPETEARPVPVQRERARDPEGHASAARAMFDRIAPTYDTLNRVMTAGIDRRWRARAVAALSGAPHGAALDLCAGTLDLSALLERAFPGERIVACDFSPKMLELGQGKVSRTESLVADALALPFEDGAFTKVICGFGVRNLADLRRGIREVRRVLAPGGVFVTLELFAPALARSRAFHGLFARRALPALGRAIAKDEEAYGYLAKSMLGFVTRGEYEDLLRDEGFSFVRSNDLTLGVASVVRAELAGAVS